MSKIRSHQIETRKRHEIVGNFFTLVAELKSRKEVIDFFIGLLTPSEMLMFARRIQIAQEILSEKTYDEIRKKLKVSYQTITNTDRWLNSGDSQKDEWIRECLNKVNKIKNNSKSYSADMADKYPQHRLMKKMLGL